MEKKKIGIITTSCGGCGTFDCNYGAALQGYALVKQLRLLGFDAYDVNYVSDNEYRPLQYGFLKRTLLRMRLIFNIPLVKVKIDRYIHRKERKIWQDAFIKFIKNNNITYMNGQFFEIKKLQEISKDFYAFITGSDVVWNPYLRKGINDRGYFLDFAVFGTKRIAYAPSFGVTQLPETSKNNLGELLRKFDAISIREESGSKLIKQITGLDVPVVLDPTMLLESKEYEEIANVPKNLPQKYIAVYRFGDLEHTKEKIIEISEKLSLPIVYIPSNNDGTFEPRYDIGPGEFVGVIRNAELVISDSFHCTVFAIINHKPFLTFFRSLPNAGKDLNGRMVDLLKMLNLRHRLVKPNGEVAYQEIFNVDFDNADIILGKMRKKSLQYLKDALGRAE